MNTRLQYLDLILFKAIAFIKSETQRSYLGLLWYVLEPALYVLIFFLLFGLGFRKGDTRFVLFLMTGLSSWKWFQSSITASTKVLNAHNQLLKQVYVPKYVFPASTLVADTFKSMFLYIILILVLVLTGSFYISSIPWLLFLLVIQTVFMFGTMCLVSGLVPFVPDLKSLINSALTMMFFMSGIFFEIREFSEGVRTLLLWNPMATFIVNYRIVLLEGGIPTTDFYLIIGSYSFVFLITGLGLLLKYDKHYPRILD